MCYCSKGLDLLRRTLCLFLCVVLLLCFFLVPRAHAVVAEAELAYWGGAIVVSVLAAGGMALATGDAQKVGSAMYAALKDTGGKAWNSIQAMAAWAASAGSKVKDAAFRVGKDVWQAITDCFSKFYSDGSFVLPSGSSITVPGDVTRSEWEDDTPLGNAVKSLFVWGKSCTYIFDTGDRKESWSFVFDGDKLYRNGEEMSFTLNDKMTFSFELGIDIRNDKPFFSVGMETIGGGLSYSLVPSLYAPFTVSVSDSVVLPAPDLKYPGDNYLVKAPDLPAVDTATGAVSWPSDAVYNKDAIALPYPIDAAGEKVADIPFDVPVDQTTGKDMTKADTGTDVKPDVKPGEGTDTDTDVKWPTETDLSLPKLIITKFPFCIPFDVARLIGLLEAEPKAPVFKVPLKYGAVMDEEITLDLSQFSDAIRIARWGELILFVAGLAYVTRNYIKW